ncbi:fibrous sheath-interacting protein 2-like [Tamandua tetradactyla]|uniref:fibrous sheath-interacting protein 2-like n=1 Tax=Tamandua tetradactyla TaxID=48850 RepID=UPI004053DB35
MDLYLSNCCKTADAAATKAATSGLTASRDQCGTGPQKIPIPEVGAAQLLDLPLGVKLPVIPGSNNVFFTTNLSEKLYQPSYDFNLTDPYCRLLEPKYQSLHDPHLKAYYKRKDILRRLKKGGYITSNNKVICTLKELNKYRQYLTTLKLDFERNYIREQKMIEEQVNKLYESKRAFESSEAAQFREWLLKEDTQTIRNQDTLLKHRYLDMFTKELGKAEHKAEKWSKLRMKEEERRHRDHIRRKLSLRKQIEEEWKTKEMFLLTKIGKEVKREARIEEQRRKNREETDRKKQILLEKKIAHHLQKMQRTDYRREGSDGSTFENKEQDGTEASSPKMKKLSDTASDRKAHQRQKRPVYHCQYGSKTTIKKSPTSFPQCDVQGDNTEQKKDREMTKTSCPSDDGGITLQSLFTSAKPTNVPRQSLQDIQKQEGKNAYLNGQKPKNSSFTYESAGQRISSSNDSSVKQQSCCQNCCQKKVTPEELNSIVDNIMTWVVASVTSVLYPAITKYEEKLQNNICPMSDDSVLYSDSSSYCSTCSEAFKHGNSTSATTKMFQAEPCTKATDRSTGQPATPLKPLSAHIETTDMGKTYHRKGQSITSGLKYNEVNDYSKFKICKSDSNTSIETGTEKPTNVTTETDGLGCPLSSDKKANAINEMELQNVFSNFKCHLKEETELILESIFPEMVSDLTETISSLSAVTAEILVDQIGTDKDLPSNVDMSSAAAEIVENVLEKLQSVVEKKCIEIFSQDDLSAHFKPDLTASREHSIFSKGKSLKASLPYTSENMSDIAEDMVHVILEKLMALASSKQNELPHLEPTTGLANWQHMKDPTYTFLQRASKRKSITEHDATNLIGKEEIQTLLSNIFSQSSLVGYIEEAISTILGYIQIGLNNERLIATEKTVVILQLLDDILTQLHRNTMKTDVRKSACPRLRSPSGTEEENILTGTRVANGPRSGQLFPPINVPGMVLYSEDENEEIDKIVADVLISSIKDEKSKLEKQVPDYWLTKGNAGFKYKRNIKSLTKPAYGGKAAFCDWGLKTYIPTFNNEAPLKEKPCLNKDTLIFNQDEKHRIQNASENVIKIILAEMVKDTPLAPPSQLDNKNGKEASLLTSRKPQGLSYEEWMNQMFPVSEICSVAQEIANSVLKILHVASSHIITATKDSMPSSVYQTSLNNADIPSKEALEIWFKSKKKMKVLSSLSLEHTKPPWLESGESDSTSAPIVDINEKITHTIFKKLNSFICPKLQTCLKPEIQAVSLEPSVCHSSAKISWFQSHLSAYTTKVVNIVLDVIQNELEHNKKYLNLRENGPPKSFTEAGFFADTEKELECVVTALNNDIMARSLVTCICEILSGNTAKNNVLLLSDRLRPKISSGTDNNDKQKCLPPLCPTIQEAVPPEIPKCLVIPCVCSSVFNGKEFKENARLQVLSRIGDTLYDMLCKLTGAHLCSPPSDSVQNREWLSKNLRMTTALQSNIQLVSNTILEDIITKLCNEMDSSFTNSEFRTMPENLDIDSLSFVSLIEEMTKCTDIISSMVSGVIQEGSQEVSNSKGKITVPKIGCANVDNPNKLKAVASDILKTVFATLKGFASKNLETLGIIINGNKKGNKMDWESGSTNICANAHEELLQCALHMHAKTVSSTILKAIQTELNVSLPDLGTDGNNPLQEKQMLKDLVNLILDEELPDMFKEPEPIVRDVENYRYRPTYGNFLPGGAEPESHLEDPEHTEKECSGEERPPEEETKSDSLKQRELEKTLKKIEVELKEPHKSPIVPIIRNILNEIFQNMLPVSHSHLCNILHANDESVVQTSVQFLNKTAALLVSEADVTTVADDVVRIIFQKLYSAATTDRNAVENRYDTITFPVNNSFSEQASGEKTSIHSTTLDRCTLQYRFNIDKLAKVSVVEDIVKSILTNLEMFVTSKVKSLFCPHINFTVPVALPLQQNETSVSQPWLSTKDSYSSDQFSSCTVDHSKSLKTTSICQLTVSKLNMYATEVARQILQGLKHKLDEEIKSPLTHNVMEYENIPSQIVNIMLDILSTKGKYEKNICGREIDLGQPGGIVKKLFNQTGYRKKLQFQILDTIEGILSDICEKTLGEDTLPFPASALKYNVGGRHSGENSETVTEYVNKVPVKPLVPKSCVSMISNDMVDIVLHNISSAVMLGINAEDSIPPRLPLSFSDSFPKVESQQFSVMDSMNEREKESFTLTRKRKGIQLKSAYSDDNQTTVLKKQNTKKYAPDPYEENAHFLTKAILNRLESFATERRDSLFTLDSQTREKLFVRPEFANHEQDNSTFLKSNQMPSDVNILKISTAKTTPSQDLTDYTYTRYREKPESVIPLSHARLKEYGDIIASTILALIKNDIDLEIHTVCLYPNNTSFQENIIARKTVNNILKSLHSKRSLKERNCHSKQNPNLFTQLVLQNEILPGQREMEDNAKLHLFSKYPDQNQIISEEENQRRVLEEIFMRNGEARHEKPTSLLSPVKEILKKVYQRVIEDIDHLPTFNKLPHFISDSKIKTSVTPQRKTFQSHVSSVANDIVESVLGKMFSIVVTSLYKNDETSGKFSASGKDELQMNTSCFRGLEKSVPPEYVIPQVYTYTGISTVTALETTLSQYPPLQVGEELIQIVVSKIRNFALVNLKESSFPKDQSDEMPFLRSHSSKTSPKGSLKPCCKTSFKTRSKVTSLPKFGTKPQLGPSGTKAKSKTKLSPGEKTQKNRRSKTAIGLLYIRSTGVTKSSLMKTKLSTAELKMYAKHTVSTILETIVNEFQKVSQNRAMTKVKALPSGQIMAANEILNEVLQGLYFTKNNHLADQIKCSHSDDLKLSQRNLNTICFANPEVHFSLENVSSHLEKVFPKEDIFKQVFDKWQTESNDMENEKYKLLMIAETVLYEILIKARELEQSVSLLNFLPLEAFESRYCSFKRVYTRAEDSQAQINIFGREIVEMLFEKLDLYFLNQVLKTDGKETLPSRKETTAKSKYSSLRTNNLSNIPICNMKLKDKILRGSSNQLAQEIIENVLHILESFVDLQFKHISGYAFSEIVKIPIENFVPAQQKPLMKKILPKLPPLNMFSDESKSSNMISQENIQNTLQQLQSFHSEFLTYTANIVNDMLSIIKNKLDREVCQVQPSSIGIFEENMVASEIISTLMDQCTDFCESLIKNHPKDNLLQGVENFYTGNWVTRMDMPTSKSKSVSYGDELPQTSVSGLMIYPKEDMKRKNKPSSNLPSYGRYSAGDTPKASEPKERLKSEFKTSYSGNETQSLNHFDQTIERNSSLPEGSILQKPSWKSSKTTETAIKQAMSLIEMGESDNQRMLHSETPKPVIEANQIEAAITPLNICFTAESIVNTILLSFGFPGQPLHTNESVETMKLYFASKKSPLSILSGEQKNEEKSLLKIWEKRISCKTDEENKSPKASGEDFTLLEKWKTKKSPKMEKTETFKEVKVVAFAEQELGVDEIYLVARYVTTSVVTHFKNFKIRGPHDDKVSIASTLSKKICESKQPLRSIRSDSSLNQFCEHLTELVISHIISNICDCSEEGETKQKALGSQHAAFSKINLVHSQVFGSQSVPIGELALRISEIIIRILFNSDILKVDVTQQTVSVKTKYIYCPKVVVADFDDLFQDLLIGVIHVLSKEIGINHQPDMKGKNKSFPKLRSDSLPICNKYKNMKRQTGPRDWISAPTHQIDQLVQKYKLNTLACKLGNLVDSLKTHESKEAVSKIFCIVLDLFLSDECQNWDMDANTILRKIFSSSNNQQSNSIPCNIPGLSPQSVFLLNIVCEKFISILLEECTTNTLLTNGLLSDEISAEHQQFNILQNVEDEELGYCREKMNYDDSLFQRYDMSHLLENLAEIDQECMLSIISHSLVKSLMEKLSHNIQPPLGSPPFADKHLKYRTTGRFSSFLKAKRPELKESRQGKSSVKFINYDSKPLTGAVNNLGMISSKIQAPLGKQFLKNPSPLEQLQKPGKIEMNTAAIHNILHPRGISTGVYSATFLEEIISKMFLSLFTLLWGKNENITEAQLIEICTIGVNSMVNELNNAQITVLQDVEERLCFPPIHKETVRKIVDSVYNDVLQEYELQAICGNDLEHVITSITEQITNGILTEILDYQLPLCFVEKLMPNSYYPLKAEKILQKLQNNIRELNYTVQHSSGYTTILPYSFLEDVIRRLLSQLIPPPSKASCLGKKYLMTLDFNEISTCIINKILLAISKHKIWLTKYDHQCTYTEKKFQKMVESVYSYILQISGSLVSVQKSIVSQSPIIIDQIASLIILEIFENHLQPFLHREGLSCSSTPLDEISNMVKEVLGEVTESYRPQKPSSPGLGIYPNTFVEQIIAKILAKLFNPQYNSELEVGEMTQKIVNSINNHFNKAKIRILHDDKEQSLPAVDTDTVDELVNSIYSNILKQHGMAPETDKELKDSDIFVENITNLVIAAISDYLFHPLFSGDLSASSYCTLTAENIIQNITSGISKSTKPNQHLSPYNTLMPHTFLEDIIRVLLSRIFPSESNMVPYRETPKDRSGLNFNEICSKVISDIMTKITQHEIRFSKDEETEFIHSEDDAQHLVDSVFRNILHNCESHTFEHDITSSDNVLTDRIAGFIIKNICEQHLQPFVYGKSSFPSLYTYFDDVRKQQFFAGVYSSVFLEDVISGVLSKIFHRVLGIVQTKPVRDSEKELLETAENLIYSITEEFSKSQVSILENATEQLCLPPIARNVVIEIVDTVYSKVLQEYEMKLLPDKDLLSDNKTLAERVTKIILAEIFHFQIHPDFIAKLPLKSYSKLNADILIKRVQNDIGKSRFQRQTSTIYTTVLSRTHLEKLVTQVLSQISSLDRSAEVQDPLQSDLRNNVMRLIDEIMLIISRHAICIIKNRDEKQNVIAETDIQAMVDAIYTDLSHSNLYQSLTKDKKGLSHMPVTKIASYIIKEIFNHHLQSFLSGDKMFPSGTVDQTKQRAIDPKQRELSLIVNSAVFLEEVIAELLCKILYVFSHNVLAAEKPLKAKASMTDIVTTLVKAIVVAFTTSQILVVDNLDEKLYFSKEYKEMVKKKVNLIYEKILDDYKSLIHVYKAIQSDAVGFGRKIYDLLLGEIYDYQVELLVSGELGMYSYSSLQDENIIRNVLDIINNDSHILPSCITVLPHSLLEGIIYKLLTHMFLSSETETELKEEEVAPDYEFVGAASKLTAEIITEISEHEIRLATAEEAAESTQLGATENFIDSICNNIMKKFKFQAEAQKDADKKGGSFIRRIAGFIMKEIVAHHLQPFLHNEESSPSDLPASDHITGHSNPGKNKTPAFLQPSVYSATFLGDFIIDLVRKFYPLPSIAEDPKGKEISGPNLVGMAIKFVNVLIGEFRKSEIKVLANAEETFSFPKVDKETVDKLSDSVYNEVIEIYGSNNIQKDDRRNTVIEMIAVVAKKAISAFKIQPLFLGDWSSSLFSFLDVDNIIQRIQHLPYKTSTQSLEGNPLTLPEQSSKLIVQTSDLKNNMGTSEIGRSVNNRKENFKKEEPSMKKSSIHEPICTAINSIMKSKIITLESGSSAGVSNKKKMNEKKKKSSVKKEHEKVSKNASTTSVKNRDTQEPDLNEIRKKDGSTRKDEKGRGTKEYKHFSPATNNTENDKVVLEPDFKIGNKKKSDEKRENSLEKEDRPFELHFWKPNVRNKEMLKKRKDPPAYRVTDDKQILEPKHVQNVTERIYSNALEISSLQGPVDDSKFQNPLGNKASYVSQVYGRDFAQPTSRKDLFSSANQNIPAKKDKKEKNQDEEIKGKPSELDSPQNPPENKPEILPANFLEDVIAEIVNKLIFSSTWDKHDTCQSVTNEMNQPKLYDMAMKLIDSLLKEFSDAQIKVISPGQGNQFFPFADKISSVLNIALRQKELSVDKGPPKTQIITMDKILPPMDSETKTHSDKALMVEIPSINKTLVNKVVHSSVCSILQEYRSQYSICKAINSNGENLAKRLANAVIEEIFQLQLNFLLCDEAPVSVCLPVESKEVIKKVQKIAQTTCKECQTLLPYTIILPREFLENLISSLLSKIFSLVTNTKTEISEDNLYTELDFLQMKLVSTVMAEISKDEDMVVQYVESLHPNDDETIQLVVQTIYNDLLPQFGSQEILQNCVISGCRILSETIVNLVVREVAANQLQNYFSGELTPHQCMEVDSVVENILNIIQTTEVPQPHPSHAYKLSFNIIEEIAVNFLSKLLSMFPKVDQEQNYSLDAEMQKIISKILKSFQEYICKSQIKVVLQAKESSTVSLADRATIEKVVSSVYNSVLKHSGSHTSVYKDLMGKSNVLSDIIGFLMVKEIYSSEFQPQVEEASSSELVLEAVKIMEKVVKIIDNLKSKEKPSSRKSSVLDATVLEEALALFLAKLVQLPSALNKGAKNLSRPELHKIASQLTKSVTAEISRNNLSVVAANPEEHVLNPESIEMISQLVDSVYNHTLQQTGTHEELYYDVKNRNRFFPEKVASLIVSKVLDYPLETISAKESHADLFGDLDLDQIVEKTNERAVKMESEPQKERSEQDLIEKVKIVPHHGKQPINVDPDIIAEHLGVISIKTQPLKKLQMKCLATTGHSIEELRRASVSGRSYSAPCNARKREKERRISLDETGRLDIEPLEMASRNSFQNLRKPDITRVELLKDVQNKKDLIIRLVAHDINKKYLEHRIEEDLVSDEEEVVLQEVVKEEFAESPFEGQIKEDTKPVESIVASPKLIMSRSSLKKNLSLGKRCHSKASVTIKNVGASSTQLTESEETQKKRTDSETGKATSQSSTNTDFSLWEKKSQFSGEERKSLTEPTHYFIHRLMSSSSYNEEDLFSLSSDDDDRPSDPSAKITEESLEDPDLKNSSSIKLITLYRRQSALASTYSSSDGISDSDKPSTSKQGSEMMKKVSSALSKVFSRSNMDIPKSSSLPPPAPPSHPPPPSHQDKN